MNLVNSIIMYDVSVYMLPVADVRDINYTVIDLVSDGSHLAYRLSLQQHNGLHIVL